MDQAYIDRHFIKEKLDYHCFLCPIWVSLVDLITKAPPTKQLRDLTRLISYSRILLITSVLLEDSRDLFVIITLGLELSLYKG